MSALLDAQMKLTRLLPKLLVYAHTSGYEVTLGDAYRDPRVHGDFGEKKSYSAAYSNHKRRLAIDLNLFRDGKFLQMTEDHRPLGEFWESIGGYWGGRHGDGNHYSIEFEGYW
jgi:hypothetical protein